MDFLKRQAALRAHLRRQHVDAMLISHLPNLRYLCGFSGSNGLLVVGPRQTTLFTDGRYREQARQEITGARVVIETKGDLWRAAAAELGPKQRLAIEADRITLAQRKRLFAHWKGLHRLVLTQGWVERQRVIKDADEIAALRRAINLASSVLEATLARMRRGMKETELAGWLEFSLRQAGGEGLAFETIVVGGARGARIHGQPGPQPLPRRGFVVMDYGVRLAGYHSDMTRTIHIGRPTAKARQIYQVVRDAQSAALAAIKPGVAASAIDRAARRVIQKAGFGAYFPHSTGHGVGLEIHEAPRLGATSQDLLQAGQVVTVEPGIYIPGWGGVRIEDVALVTATGAEGLTPTPKELLTYGL
jgi:Xaa-Pro aminopeptidase